MICSVSKVTSSVGVCVIAWNVFITMAVFAASPARAQTLQPSVAALLGFECRIVQDAECACAPGRGQPTMPYTELTGLLARQPPQPADMRDGPLRQAIWRRQCGVLTEADTAP